MSKIALVTLDYPPKQGGVARYLYNLVRASQGMIDVFAEQTVFMQPTWPRWLPTISWMRRLRKQGYDWILVSHVLPLGTAAWLARLTGGARYAVLLHGLDIRLAQSTFLKSWLTRRILRNADAIIANSSFTAEEIRRFDLTLRPHIVTPGVEPMVYSPITMTTRQQVHIPEDSQVILSVCRLVPRKGIDRLIDALPSLPKSVRLVVVGDGLDRERLQRLSESVRDQVLFVPQATDEERNAWYHAADVFALPVREEKGDVEGFGIVYLEAAMAGLPVVAGKSGGAVEAVLDGMTGILVDPNDRSALVEALKRLIQEPALRKQYGEQGRARALRDFRWEDRWQEVRKILHI